MARQPEDPATATRRYAEGAAAITAGSVGMALGFTTIGLGFAAVSAVIIALGILRQYRNLPYTGWRDATITTILWTTIAGALVAIGILVLVTHPLVVVAATFLSSLTVAPLGDVIGDDAAEHRRAGIWLGTGFLLFGLGVGLAVQGEPLLAAAALVIGLVPYRAGLLPIVTKAANTQRSLHRSTAAFVVGVILMAFAVRTGQLVAGGIGAFLIFLALIAIAVVVPANDYRPLSDRAFAAIGVLFAIGSVFVFWSAIGNDVLAWALAIGFALLGAALGRAGETVVIGLIIALVIGWTAVERDEVADPVADPDAVGRIAAIGDSYISGEGATRFYSGTNQVGEDENECRRAPTAYPVIVAEALGRGLDFYACSGARTFNLLREDGDDGLVGQMPESPSTTFGALVQLEYLREQPDVDAVLISIGGNDVGFSEIAQGCLLTGNCTELSNLWLSNIESIGPSVRRVYAQAKEIVGDDVPIVAMPYPMMLAEQPCGWSLLDPDEHEFLVEFVVRLNQQIQVSAQREGVNFFAPGLTAFEGERICDGGEVDGPAMNRIWLEPPNGALGDAIRPNKWIHHSMHPTERGHALTAQALEPYLAELLGAEQPNPDPDPAALLEIGSIRATQPRVVSTTVHAELLASDSPTCRDLDPAPIGERLLLVDQAVEPSDTDDTTVGVADRRVPSFVLDDTAPNSQLCFKEGNGPWTQVAPADVDLTAADPDEAIARIPIVIDDDVVSVQPVVPDDGDQLQVVYRRADGTTQHLLVEFCSELDTCPSSVAEWTTEQLGESARELTAPIVVAILAGWFLIVGLHPRRPDDHPERPLYQRLRGHLARWWSRRRRPPSAPTDEPVAIDG